MDRYLERNRDEVRLRRKEVATLKLKLQELRKRLSRYINVGFCLGRLVVDEIIVLKPQLLKPA